MNLEWVAKVIERGDYGELDVQAKNLGKVLKTAKATKTQVRNIFGTVKRLETLQGKDLERDLVLLRPRLAYTAARVNGLNDLRDVLTKASQLAEKDCRERVPRLVDLMEAILCYWTAEQS